MTLEHLFLAASTCSIINHQIQTTANHQLYVSSSYHSQIKLVSLKKKKKEKWDGSSVLPLQHGSICLSVLEKAHLPSRALKPIFRILWPS
jgi:hypothetical protein